MQDRKEKISLQIECISLSSLSYSSDFFVTQKQALRISGFQFPRLKLKEIFSRHFT